MATKQLDISLHAKQLDIFKDDHRFRVVAAGRRWGKTTLMMAELISEAMTTERAGVDLKDAPVWYVAPTYGQAESILWRHLKKKAEPITKRAYEVDLILEVVTGRHVALKGAEKPDRLRGDGLPFVGLDEFASMRGDVWEYALRPALIDYAPASRALFIGTPDPEEGKNHFFDLYEMAASQKDPNWAAWAYKTADNPFIPREEIELARQTMTARAFRRELEASFEDDDANELNHKLLETVSSPNGEGNVYMAIDLAGFASPGSERRKTLKRRDESAMAVVRASESGWHVLEIIHGQWSVRETATRILAAVRQYKPNSVGIEKGALKQALEPYLHDEMQRFGVRFPIQDLHHGGQNKAARIRWALSGRLEHKRITCEPGKWVHFLKRQMRSFPAEKARDDMLDALSYIDQMAVTTYYPNTWEDSWQPLDDAVGF